MCLCFDVQGHFEGPMLLKTFAYAHMPVIQAVPDDLRSSVEDVFQESVPIGALVMAALAVCSTWYVWPWIFAETLL